MTELPQGDDRKSIEAEIKRSIDLKRVTEVLLNDRPPKPVDAVFFFGRSYFDAGKKDIFQVATDMIKEGRAKYIFIPDSEGQRVGGTIPREANPGKTLWTDRLVRLGVDKNQIIYCPHPIPGELGFHTRNESDAFLRTAANKGLNTAVVLTNPHQIVRAMLGVVKTINDTGQEIDVWCMVPDTTGWNKRVMGSQGKELKPRRDHVPSEIDRIFKYQAQADLASFDDLYAYLAKRDNRQKSQALHSKSNSL